MSSETMTWASIGERLEGLLDETFPVFPDAIADSTEHCAFFALLVRRLERSAEVEKQAGETKLRLVNLGMGVHLATVLTIVCRASPEECPEETWRGPGGD